MVREREPPRSQVLPGPVPTITATNTISAAPSAVPLPTGLPGHLPVSLPPPLRERINLPQQALPQFGAASPLRNPLQSKPTQKPVSVFNVPRPGQARLEHHRPRPVASKLSVDSKQTILLDGSSPDVSIIEIPRPVNAIPPSIMARPMPMFSSARSGPTFSSANSFKIPQPPVRIDLTKPVRRGDEEDSDGGFDPERALGEERFGGAFDPTNFVDATQASENIKALLEGAFGDDEEKPRTRQRKKKQDAVAASLVESMKALKVESESKIDAPHEPEEDEDDGSVEGLNVKLLPHQIDGLSWMLDKEIGERKKNGVLPKGGILADDMGLGKTIQALSLILSNPRPSAEDLAKDKKRKIPEAVAKGTLVVAPLALIKQWESEIKTKVDTFPKMKVLVHHGATRTKRAEDLKKYDVVVTTYQTLTSEHEGSSESDQGLKVGCFGVYWYRTILDEAHSIKNKNAKMTKAAYALKSVYRWCLTGTPMQNNLDELQSLIHFLRIKPYNDMRTWKEQITQPMKSGKGGLAMKRLQFFLKAFMKRRTKEILKREGGLTFGKGIPQGDGKAQNSGFRIVARNVETIIAEFDDAERELYDRLAARTEKSLETMMGSSKNDYIGALVLLLRLRQACNHPELIRGNLRKEKDSLSAGAHDSAISQTPRKGSSANTDLDDMADMFGAMTVQTRKCDVCQSSLDKAEIAAGAIRCIDCDADLDTHRRRSKEHKKPGSSATKHRDLAKSQTGTKPVKHRRNMKRIVDSDDEDDQGEWLVPESQRTQETLGNAGGTDDEDAEGGGDWLGADDSDTDDASRATDGTPFTVKMQSSSRKAHRDSFISYDDSGAEDTSYTSASTKSRQRTTHDISSTSGSTSSGPVISTKIRHLLSLLHAHSSTNKFIVFSEFTSMLDLIEPFLIRDGLRFTRYDGSMRNDDREASLERLRNDSRTRILLCSLRCGSLGLNLTAASRVVIMEPFWNPFVEEQAIDRVHRLNQTQDVIVYRLTIADSVEERILDLQAKKRELATAAIEGGNVKAAGKLSMGDILSLFKRDAEHGSNGVIDGAGFELAQGRSMGLLEGVASPRKVAGGAAVNGRENGNGNVNGLGQGFTKASDLYNASVGTTAGPVFVPPKAEAASTNVKSEKEKPKFVIPPSMRNQFGAAYSRRW